MIETILLCLVIGIADGDTLTASCSGKQIKVRLAEIDAPEMSQPFGNLSKQSLSNMCLNKQAVIKPKVIDRYGRTVARVICNETDTSVAQVKRGLAWVYDKYVKDQSLYTVQRKAKALEAGLWSDPNPIKPWKYRHK